MARTTAARIPRRSTCPARTAGRVLLHTLALVAVVVGLVGMHALTGGHHQGAHAMSTPPTDAGGHGVAGGGHQGHGASATHASAPATGSADRAGATAAAGQDQDEHSATAGCVLFLTAVGIALLIALKQVAFRPSHPLHPRLRRAWVPSLRHRGPPPWAWPRFALCVVRT
ncbi:hypothetical protein NUM3379_24020 [Kineococcus sp. NUM-3379]